MGPGIRHGDADCTWQICRKGPQNRDNSVIWDHVARCAVVEGCLNVRCQMSYLQDDEQKRCKTSHAYYKIMLHWELRSPARKFSNVKHTWICWSRTMFPSTRLLLLPLVPTRIDATGLFSWELLLSQTHTTTMYHLSSLSLVQGIFTTRVLIASFFIERFPAYRRVKRWRKSLK